MSERSTAQRRPQPAHGPGAPGVGAPSEKADNFKESGLRLVRLLRPELALVVVVIVLEMGLISPPVGVNVFVVKGVAPDVPLATIFRGIWPFWLAMLVCIMVLVAFPGIALYLPNTMF